MEQKYWCRAEDFIRVYMAHRTNKEVAEVLGLSANQVSDKACKLRKLGVRLPIRTGRPQRIDVQALNGMIGKVLGEGPVSPSKFEKCCPDEDEAPPEKD